MDTVTLEDVRNEIRSSLNSAVDAIDWKDKFGLPDPVVPMAQDLPQLPEAFSNLDSWMRNRDDKPLGDNEVLRFSADQYERGSRATALWSRFWSCRPVAAACSAETLDDPTPGHRFRASPHRFGELAQLGEIRTNVGVPLRTMTVRHRPTWSTHEVPLFDLAGRFLL